MNSKGNEIEGRNHTSDCINHLLYGECDCVASKWNWTDNSERKLAGFMVGIAIGCMILLCIAW